MKPEYYHFKPNREDRHTITAHIPPSLREPLETLAKVEGGGVAGLVLEGVIRVLHDRSQDPGVDETVRAAIPTYLKERANAIETSLAQTKSALDSFSVILES